MLDTKISWTNHTLNFWHGCKKVSQGCKFCYMFRDKDRFNLPMEAIIKSKPATINKVLKKAKAGDKIFVCSWSDFFIKEADEWRTEAWQVIRDNPHLTFQILTKRPERIANNLPKDWGRGYNNVWLGVSVENKEQLKTRGWQLCETPAKIRFLSVEPILEQIELAPLFLDYYNGIDWVIIGGESGNKKGKHGYRKSLLKWYSYIVGECKIHNIAVFVKQLGTHVSEAYNLSDRHGGNINEFPRDLQIRQFPFKHRNKAF